MPFCPKHIEDSVINAANKFPHDADEFHHYFQVLCKVCGSNLFHLFLGIKRTVKASCGRCQGVVLVYDLALYPAASKPKGDERFSELELTKAEALPIYVSYEYGEFDDDQEFDQNDITWCQVFVEREGKLLKVFDDETA